AGSPRSLSDRFAARAFRGAGESGVKPRWKLAVTHEGTRWVIALLLLYAMVYLVPLGVRPLASPDEVRYGAIAHEMLATGDWISPHFDGLRYFEKPVLGHWLNALSMKLLGESALALRLPVALATGLTALLVLALARRFATPFAARLAAVVYLTTFIVAGIGTFAVLDAFLALFLTAALAAFYCALESRDARTRRTYLALCGAACGAAFLVKGLLALAIPVLVAAPYLAARRRWKTLFTAPWIPIAVAVAVALPWSVLIQLREPDFWRYFFWVEHVHRFVANDAQHAQPFWYFIAWLPAVGWPWSLLLPSALLGLRTYARAPAVPARAPSIHGRAQSVHAPALSIQAGARSVHAPAAPAPSGRFIGYLAAWAALPFLLVSLSSGKLITYILPCFAPLAILVAVGLERYLGQGKAALLRAAALVIAAVFVVLLALLAAAQAGVFGTIPFGPTEKARLAGFAALFVVGSALAIYAALTSDRTARLAALAGTGVALLLPIELMPPQVLLDDVAPAGAVARFASAPPDAIVVADASLVGTVAWVLKRNDIYVLGTGELAYGLSYPEAQYRHLDARSLADLIKKGADDRPVLIVSKSGTERDIGPVLPARAERIEHGKIVIWRIPPAAGSPRSEASVFPGTSRSG
ncbi:MAG TPA: phospholipid carrier-dependent glycosyltransferase, partial [Gammaproteobacteria bacterium]|nr:phospholipid carrier-dependent glycosyltransferase [Gammaproteobacteria bacterium]